MAKIRFGYSDDFTAKNNKIGINTTIAQEKVDVVGVVKGKDLRVTGVSSQTGYEGFLRADHQIEEETQLNFGQGINASLSGEIIVGTGQTVTVNTVQDDPLGPELITNGNFDSDVSGWTAATNTAVALDGGRIKITNSTTVYGSAYQDITVVPGETYVINVHYAGGTGSGNYHVGDTSTSNKYLSAVSGKKAFTPESTIARVVLNVGGNTSGHYVLFDSITVKKENNVSDKTTRAGGSQIECMKVYNTFTPPSGDTNQRPSKPKPGELYYNYDFKTIEFHDGYGWRQVDNTTRSGRAVFMGGEAPTPTYALSGKNISYANISSLGNSNNFGDLSLNGKYGASGMSNSTRGVIAGGWNSSPGPGNQFDIEYITIASEGNAIDWGENNTGGWGSSGSSSSTRGLSAGGGYPSASVTIDSIFFSTTGTKEDWGDITALRARGTTSCNDTTRSVFFGGYAPVHSSLIEYKTTASNGNTIFFGDLITTAMLAPGMSSSTRGVMGTQDYDANDAGMGYITIATTGNAQYFGDLTVARGWGGATANQVRGLYVGGRQGSTYYNTIDYCTISTAGNFVDFGDLTGGNDMQKACVSDSHGGLGGF